MIKLTVDNVYTKIENISKSTELTIWNKLSFEIEEFGQEYNRVRHLYNRKTKKTYTGLLPYIEEILKDFDEEYEIIDKRVKHKSDANFQLQDYIIVDGEKKPLQLRPYQKKIVDQCSEREVLQCATGGGKTFIMAALVAKYNVKPISVFADKITLCSQIKEEFEKFLGIPIGLVGGGINQKEDITVYSVQSATSEDIKDSKMILFDECLTYDSLVLVEDGIYRKIGELVEEKSEMGVISYNHETGNVEVKKIISHSKIPLSQNNKKLMRIKIRTQNNTLVTLECTDNHKIWVEDLQEYVMVKDLIKGNTVIINKF